MTTADRLRESVNALPEEIRDVWAPNRGADQIVGAKYAVDPIDFVVADDLETPVMEHIALTASPDRVLALADLLDAIHDLAAYDRGVVIDGYARDETYRRYTAHVAEVLERRDRLTALIEGSTDA